MTYRSSPTARQQDMAEREARDGTFTVRARRVLDALQSQPTGMTWRELGSRLGLHHGQISGALSNLHRTGHVFMLTAKRDRCHPYVHVAFRSQFVAEDRIDHPSQTKAGRQKEIEREILDLIIGLRPDAISVWRDGSNQGNANAYALEQAIIEYRRLRGE